MMLSNGVAAIKHLCMIVCNFKCTDAGEIIHFGSIKFSYCIRLLFKGKNLLSMGANSFLNENSPF